MNVQNIKIRNEGSENVDPIEDWLKVRTISVFDKVRKYFKQICAQQVQSRYERKRSIKAQQRDILNNLPLVEKHRLGLYNLMD